MKLLIAIVLLLIALTGIAVYSIDNFTKSRAGKRMDPIPEYRRFTNAVRQRTAFGMQSPSWRAYS